MGKPARLLIGILTIIPIAYICLFFGAFVLLVLSESYGKASNRHAARYMPALFLTLFGVMPLMYGLITFYIVRIFKSNRMSENKKLLWALAIFMGSPVAMPIFWFVHVWRDPAESSGTG